MARTPDDEAGRAEDEAPVAAPLDAGGVSACWRGGIPPRWRRPLLGALTVALVVGVAAGLFARAASDPRAALSTLLGAPTATPALLPTSIISANNTFAAADGVPWGALTISSQPMSPAEMAGALFHLSPGKHTLAYIAAGFPTLRCVISVPPAASDTCPLANPRAVSDTPQAYSSARVLDLLATPARLDPASHAALLAAIARTLTASGGTATISPGELWSDPRTGTTQRASVALTYRVTPEIATPDESRAHLSALGGQPCGPICAGWIDPQRAQTSASQSDWRLVVMVRPTRAVMFPDGQRLSNEQADARGVSPVALLAAPTAGGWQVSRDPTGLPAGIAIEGPASLTCPPSMQAAVAGVRTLATGIMSYWLMPAPNPADGCVVDVMRAATNCAPICAPMPPLLVIVRFGVILAASVSTHDAYPSLPLADPTAQRIAANVYTDATTPG